jgi:hypothetical protein
VGEACRKLEESRRLDPLPGTILNLAACHEREGLTASALAEFREARAMADRDGRADRVAYADEHLRALEPRLSKLVIVVPPAADLADLAITRDGALLGRAAWGTPIPVDPGPHVVVATAAGRTAERIELTVKPEGDSQTATLAPLVEVAPSPPPAPPPSPAPAAAPSPAPVPPPPPATHGLSTQRVLALVAAGAGVAAVGVGAGFGLNAIAKNGASPQTPTTHGQAGESADLSTAFFIGGAVALAAGATLWFTDSVAVTPGVGRLDVVGRF